MPGVSDCSNLERKAQGCLRSQQCYCHLLTRYLIFKNVLIVYGIILECTDVT